MTTAKPKKILQTKEFLDSVRPRSREILKKDLVDITTTDLRVLGRDPAFDLWELFPELYQWDPVGECFIKNKDGSPKRKPGKKLGIRQPRKKSRKKPEMSPETIQKRKDAQRISNAKSQIKKKKAKVARMRIAAERTEKRVKSNEKALKAAEGTSKDNVVSTDHLPVAVQMQIEKDEAEIIFQPNAGPQTEFLASSELQVLYGGAAGGGKSYAMLADPLRQMGNKHAKALLIRRTMPELRELIDKSHELYPKAYPGAKFKQMTNTWTFPSGAKLEFGFCEKDSDVYRYQGQAYTWIGFDELTQWPTAFCWNYLFSRLRDASGTGIDVAMRATANPGGVGGHWVKEMFIDPAPANETFGTPVHLTNGDIQYVTRRFIPALLKDNPYLSNGQYELTLASLPPVLRQQLLEGNWDVIEGAAFPEFDPKIHIIAPFEIPAHWERIKGIDYGYASESACIWAAVDPEDGTLIIYRELYRKGLTGSELGAIIREMELPDVRSVPGVLDTAAWSQAGGGYKGPTVGEVLVQMGHKLRRADKNRKAGKVQVHERLAKSHSGRPKMQIFSTCPNMARELQSLPAAKNDPEDVDTHAQDHAYDALRYLIMSRPRLEGHIERLARFRSEYEEPSDNVFGY